MFWPPDVVHVLLPRKQLCFRELFGEGGRGTNISEAGVHTEDK